MKPSQKKEGKPLELFSEPRDRSLDFLRGTAVVLMIIAHTNAFFYAKSGTALDFITWLGATVCATVFTFVSGAISGMTIKKGTMTRYRAFMRGFLLLDTYYILALLFGFFNEKLPSTIGTTIDILTFKMVPLFTEFFLPFMFFPMLVALFYPVLRKSRHHQLILISVSLFAYALSTILYEVDWGRGYAGTLKAILVGSGDLHRFPLLSYLPVYSIGIWWGMRDRSRKASELSFSKNMLFVSINICLVLMFTNASVWNRWPPSLLFLSYGFIFIFGMIFLYNRFNRLTYADEICEFLGHFSLSYTLYHLLTLLFIKTLIVSGPLGDLETSLLTVVVFLVSTALLILIEAKNLVSKLISLLLF